MSNPLADADDKLHAALAPDLDEAEREVAAREATLSNALLEEVRS